MLHEEKYTELQQKYDKLLKAHLKQTEEHIDLIKKLNKFSEEFNILQKTYQEVVKELNTLKFLYNNFR